MAAAPKQNELIEKRSAEIYGQDCEFYKYRDGLKWNRFQTVYALEGGLLYGLYQVQALGQLEKIGLVLLVTAMDLLIFLLIVVDEKDCDAHLKRMKLFEEFHPYVLNRPPQAGKSVTRCIMATVIFFNAFLTGWSIAAPMF